MSAGLGEAAAVATALLWGVSSQVQGAIARTIGAAGITLLRLPYQIFFLTIFCMVIGEKLVLTPLAFTQLAISGFLLICCCDFALYRAMTIIGPAMALLILSLSTGFSALFGWLFLDEYMSLQVIGGIAVTLAGIAWVITEHSGSILLPGQEIPKGKALAFGVFLAVFASLSFAASFIFLKKALIGGVSPLWAALLRMLVGGLIIWTVGLFRGWTRSLACSLRANPRFYWILFLSSFCGAMGSWLASLAVHLAPVGIAATLIGLQPIMVTIIGALWYHRLPSPRAASGILIAFSGTALVCLR
jgi:drug/metabolite transporter (DMT)-like permease